MFNEIKRLFGKNSITTEVNHFSSLVGEGMLVNGPVSFASTLKVDGKVCGNVIGDDKSILYVGRGAAVVGDIQCDVVIIEGTVSGTIKAREVCFHDTANFGGEFVEYEIIKVAPGAVLHNAKLIKSSLDQSETAKPE